MSQAKDREAALTDPGARPNRRLRFNDEANRDLTFVHRFQSTGRVKNLMSTDSGGCCLLLVGGGREPDSAGDMVWVWVGGGGVGGRARC